MVPSILFYDRIVGLVLSWPGNLRGREENGSFRTYHQKNRSYGQCIFMYYDGRILRSESHREVKWVDIVLRSVTVALHVLHNIMMYRTIRYHNMYDSYIPYANILEYLEPQNATTMWIFLRFGWKWAVNSVWCI